MKYFFIIFIIIITASSDYSLMYFSQFTSWKQGSRQASRDSTTGGCQTGEGSETGRISVVETVQELWESSVSTRDDLAETDATFTR